MQSPKKAQLGVSLMFFSNGALVASLLPRLPEVKLAFGLTNTAFGFLVIAMPIGAILAGSIGAPLVRKLGTKMVTIVGTALIGVLIAVAGFAGHPLLFALPLFLTGMVDAVVDAAQNIQGVIVEKWRGRSVINSLHALWSLGAAAGGAVAAWAAGAAFPLGPQLVITGVLWSAIGAFGATLAATPLDGQKVAEEESNRGEVVSVARRPWLILVPLVVIAICGALVEDVANNWATLFLFREAGAPAGIAALGFTLVLCSQFVGRILGDPMTDRWGRGAVAAFGGILIAVGAGLVVFVPGQVAPFIGFALGGFGSATLVPAAYAAAARIPGLPHGTGIAVLGWLMRIGFLATSPVIGLISDQVGLRLAMLVPLGAGLMVAVLAVVAWGGKRATAS